MRALVLSGGGSKGAFQVGVLKSLIESGYSARGYKAIAGVSVGALNGAYLAQFKPANFLLAVSKLEDFWMKVKTRSVYKRWFPFGKLHGLWKSSIYDSSPLKKMVEENIDPEKIRSSGIQLRVGAVDLGTGDYVSFGPDNGDIRKAVLASSAFPAMLEAIEKDGRTFTDGGVRNTAPAGDMIQIPEVDHLDVILTTPEKPAPKTNKKWNALDVALRSIDILMDEIVVTDLKTVARINALVDGGISKTHKLVTMRVYRPKYELADPLDFNHENIVRMFNHGLEVGRL